MALFNQKRKEAAAGGKVWKYLTYALGEIIIVICGILIALQVNNWNDRRKAEAEVEALVVTLQEEVRSNLASCRQIGQWGLMKDTLIQKVLSEQATEEDFARDTQLQGLITNYFPYYAKREQVNKVLAQADTWPEAYQPIIGQLRTYRSRMDLTQETGEALKTATLETIAQMRDTYTWFARQDPKSLERKFRYMATDSLFYNQVANYHLLGVRNFTQQAELTATFEGLLRAEIARITADASTDSLEQLLLEDGWQPLPNVAQDTLGTPPFSTTYALGGLALNHSQDTLLISLPGAPVPPAELLPGDVGAIHAPAGQVLLFNTPSGQTIGQYVMARNALVVVPR